MQNVFKLKTLIAAGGVAVFAMLAAPVMTAGHVSLISAAQAEESHTDSGGHEGGKGGDKGAKKGKGGSHESGSGGASKSAESALSEEEEGGKGSMGSTTHGKGSYQDKKMSGSGKGGPSAESDAKGPRYSGGASTGSKGGKPVWSQEGIDESVEMGRLNVARSPAKVIDKATLTALATLQANPALYTLPNLDAVIAAIKSGTINGTAIVRIDSPLENLGLYKDVRADGTIANLTTPLSPTDLAAIFLGGAADKTVPITAATVNNMNVIMQLPAMSAEDAATLAAKADAVRAAILEAHGE